MKEIDVATIPRIHEHFSAEEIRKYASYHCLVETEEGSEVCHVWRSIGGSVDYLGTTDELSEGQEPEFQRELDFQTGPVIPPSVVERRRARFRAYVAEYS